MPAQGEETFEEWGARFDAALDVAGADWPEMFEQLTIELHYVQGWVEDNGV